MEKNKIKMLEDALIKRALGYDIEEVVEEFAVNEEKHSKTLVKTKRTFKHIVPDLTAIKILLEFYKSDEQNSLATLTTEQLFEERDRLLEELKNFNKEDFDE